jgi:hypothetical protein
MYDTLSGYSGICRYTSDGYLSSHEGTFRQGIEFSMISRYYPLLGFLTART